MDTSGFYSTEWQEDSTQMLLYAPNFVYGPDYELVRALHLEYSYPVHGWRWFSTEADARAYYGIPEIVSE